MTSKESNPKDIIGSTKSPLSVIPTQVIHEVGLGMLEGACKYGRHNYRAAGVRASVYYDATMRHLNSWWEGEDIDPDSGLSHVTKAIASLAVLRDAMLNDKVTDDRPPSVKNPHWMQEYNRKAQEIIGKYSNVNPKHYTIEYKEPITVTLPDVPNEIVNKVTENASGLLPGQSFPYLLRRETDYPTPYVDDT